jgi:hypothetical protein
LTPSCSSNHKKAKGCERTIRNLQQFKVLTWFIMVLHVLTCQICYICSLVRYVRYTYDMGGGRGVNVPAFQSPCSALEGKNSGKTPKIPRVFIIFPMKIASTTNFQVPQRYVRYVVDAYSIFFHTSSYLKIFSTFQHCPHTSGPHRFSAPMGEQTFARTSHISDLRVMPTQLAMEKVPIHR